MKIWVITDTHFNHSKLIKYGRPEDYERRIQKNLFRILNGDDLLIHLGDVALKNPTQAHDDRVVQWPCKKWLCLGNHDNSSMGFYLNYWDAVAEYFLIKRYGKRILLSHYPAEDQGWFDINVHGHFHDNDHRRADFLHVLNPNVHKLLAIENTNYEPVLLEKLIQ